MSTPVNLLGRVRGSCSVHYIGQDYWFKDTGAMEVDLKPVEIGSDAYGALSQRQTGRLITLTGTPVGVWTAPQIAPIYPQRYLNPRLGDYNTPVRTVSSVDDVAGNIVSNGHGFLTGTGVRFGVLAGGTLPAGLSTTTTYYLWCNADGNTVQLYDTEAHALASTGGTTGQVIPSSAGSGTIRFIMNTPLIITTEDGVQLTIWNSAPVEMPDLTLGTTESMMKQMKFEGYTLSGQQWSDANSLYTLATGVIGAVPPQQSQIPTVPYTIDVETRLPVTAVNTGTGKLTIASHGLVTGQAVTADVLSTGGTLPTPLVAGTTYYAIASDPSNIQLATSFANAESSTEITLTGAGSGTIDIVPTLELAGLQSRDLVEISTKITWKDVGTNGNGLMCRSISKVVPTVAFVPDSLDYSSVLGLLALQGGTAASGQALPMSNIDVYGPGYTPFIRVYGASLMNAPARFGTDADRVDKLTFRGNRTFRGTSPNPFVAIGVAAPTV